MINKSALENIFIKGKYGNFVDKKDSELLKISEIKNQIIYQLARFSNSNYDYSQIKIDDLNLPTTLKTSFNNQTRINWMGPNNWMIVSSNQSVTNDLNNQLLNKEFAVTDLSHSRTIIEIEGKEAFEVIKKGSPLNLNNIQDGNCANSIYHGINVTIDFISSRPQKIRLYSLRSFGESFYESITDASLEFGYLVV